MADFIYTLLGLAAGVLVVGSALLWAFRPQDFPKRSRFAQPSGASDPMTAVGMDRSPPH